MSHFHVGQHVVCIDDNFPRKEKALRQGNTFPVKGVVYTVRGVFTSPISGRPSLRLVEIVNPVRPYSVHGRPIGSLEWGPSASRFRPLQKIKIEDFMNIDEPVDA